MIPNYRGWKVPTYDEVKAYNRSLKEQAFFSSYKYKDTIIYFPISTKNLFNIDNREEVEDKIYKEFCRYIDTKKVINYNEIADKNKEEKKPKKKVVSKGSLNLDTKEDIISSIVSSKPAKSIEIEKPMQDNSGVTRVNNTKEETMKKEEIITKPVVTSRKLPQIINSLLETDFYKFTMGQAIYHQFSDYNVTWDFKCRNKDVRFTEEMVNEIIRQIKLYCDLSFTEDELQFLDNIKFIKTSYVDFLRLWHPRFEDFEINYLEDPDTCGLSITTKGTWLNTSMYEIPTLAIVNEVYYLMKYSYAEIMKDATQRLTSKLKDLESGKYSLGNFSEFGIRRRLCGRFQDALVKELANSKFKNSTFVGTSNVYLAKKYNVKPIGTMAHEWIMCIGQGNHKYNPAYSNHFALKAWVKEYGIFNGIALTDTITTDCFLKDFDVTYATLFSGVRHDSSDPYEWGGKMIEHYISLGIDPMTKTLLFSDSLDFVRANRIYHTFCDSINVAFGIGTFLSNDTSKGALNIVMKPVKCNGADIAKISDCEGKGMCRNPDYVEYLNRAIDWRMNN